MRVLIAGGNGFMGSALSRELTSCGHEVWILTRRIPKRPNEIQWDGRSVDGWAHHLSTIDAVANLTGYGLDHWPWTARQRQRFIDSRVTPASALTAAIASSHPRPRVFLQISGVNYYGATGPGIVDESSPPADDFLAGLTVRTEAASRPLEDIGVRRVMARSAVVLAAHARLFLLMALPVRLFIGGPLGSGEQALPWIHVSDQARALRLLLERDDASGAFNLIAPTPTSNAEFMRAAAKALRRPYWFRTPAFLMRVAIGDMSTLALDGRYSRPRRLQELGFEFKYPTIVSALAELVGSA